MSSCNGVGLMYTFVCTRKLDIHTTVGKSRLFRSDETARPTSLHFINWRTIKRDPELVVGYCLGAGFGGTLRFGLIEKNIVPGKLSESLRSFSTESMQHPQNIHGPEDVPFPSVVSRANFQTSYSISVTTSGNSRGNPPCFRSTLFASET